MVRARSLAAVLAASALMLTGCGTSHPGVAATVGSEAITVQQVDDLAGALCGINGTSQTSGQARSTALQVFILTELAAKFGADNNATYDTAQLDTQMAGAAGLLSSVSEDYRPTLTTIIEDYLKGTLMVTDVGRKSLIAQGQQSPDDTSSAKQGQLMLLAAGIPVTVDPRFGTWTPQGLSAGSGSVSVPVSASATGSGTLPGFSTCG